MKIWRLDIGMRYTSDRNKFVLASWSYVTGYWRWAIYLNRAPLASADRFGWSYLLGYRNGWATLPLVGTLSIQTQPPNERMKQYAKAQP